MKRRAVFAAAAALALVALASESARADEIEPIYSLDSEGRPLRTAFDPGRRMTLGIGWAFDTAGAHPRGGGAVSVSTGALLRHRIEFADEGIVWKLEHQLARASVVSGNGTTLVGEAYELHFLRWSKDGAVVLPTSPPRRLAFPLDIGFDVGAGSVDLRRDHGLSGEIGVARGDVLFDLIRRPDHRGFLTFGVGPRYALRLADGRVVDQVVAPFSQPEVEARVELGRGHHVLAARAGGGYAWSASHGGGRQARGSASYELVALALNDAPVSIRFETSFRYDDPALPGRAPVEARGGASAVFGLPFSSEPTLRSAKLGP